MNQLINRVYLERLIRRKKYGFYNKLLRPGLVISEFVLNDICEGKDISFVKKGY